jgi:hypothetical protein
MKDNFTNNNAHRARQKFSYTYSIIGEYMLAYGSSDPLQMTGGSMSHRSLAILSTASRHYDNTGE